MKPFPKNYKPRRYTDPDDAIYGRLIIAEQAIKDLEEAVEALQPGPEPELKIAHVVHKPRSNFEADDVALFDWLSGYNVDITQLVIFSVPNRSIEYWQQFNVILLPYGYSDLSLANLLASEVPIISVEEGFADDLELGTGEDTFRADGRAFNVRDNTHPIMTELSLGTWEWSGSGFMWTQATNNAGYTETATVLVDNGEVGKDILIVHKTKKYAFFGWYRSSQWPDEGWSIMKKTIEWAIDRLLL